MLRTLIAMCCLAGVGAACGSANGVEDCSGACTESHHIWGPTEIAADISSQPFVPGTGRTDHLYKIRCAIVGSGSRAVCSGYRLLGRSPRRRITVRALLRGNGSWDLICWPKPSALCAPVQVKEQRAHPLPG